MSKWALALVLAAASTIAADARADDAPPPPTCPVRVPTDAASCPRAMTCRYPVRGVVCACQRVPEGERHPYRWVCGELGE